MSIGLLLNCPVPLVCIRRWQTTTQGSNLAHDLFCRWGFSGAPSRSFIPLSAMTAFMLWRQSWNRLQSQKYLLSDSLPKSLLLPDLCVYPCAKSHHLNYCNFTILLEIEWYAFSNFILFWNWPFYVLFIFTWVFRLLVNFSKLVF